MECCGRDGSYPRDDLRWWVRWRSVRPIAGPRRRGRGLSGNVMTGSTTMTTATFEALFDEVSNWARWDDESPQGTLHHLTPDRIVAAARLVRAGFTVSLGLPLDSERRVDNPA